MQSDFRTTTPGPSDVLTVRSVQAASYEGSGCFFLTLSACFGSMYVCPLGLKADIWEVLGCPGVIFCLYWLGSSVIINYFVINKKLLSL